MTEIFISTAKSALAACTLATLLIFHPAFGAPPKEPNPAEQADQLVAAAKRIFQSFAADPSKKSFQKALSAAQGVLIVPRLVRVGFIFGGSSGHGVLVVRNAAGKWTGPAFYSLGDTTVGLQFGLQLSEIVILVMNQDALNLLVSSKGRGGFSAHIAFGPVGSGAQSSLQGGLITVSRSSMLYGGVNLERTMVSAEDAWNTAYYGTRTLAADILEGRTATPLNAEGLLSAVSEAAASPPETAATEHGNK